MGAARPQISQRKLSVDGSQTSKSAKVFSLESFPLYGTLFFYIIHVHVGIVLQLYCVLQSPLPPSTSLIMLYTEHIHAQHNSMIICHSRTTIPGVHCHVHVLLRVRSMSNNARGNERVMFLRCQRSTMVIRYLSYIKKYWSFKSSSNMKGP